MPLVLEPSWLGQRVTVRRVVERDDTGRLLFGDVVGDLVELTSDLATVDTRDGPVEIPTALVAIAKLVPPSSADELAVEAMIARGWRAAETAHVGGWLLRANQGFTGRANSVLPLRSPRRSLDDAIAEARRWYAERGLPLRFQVPTESRRLLDVELAERGFEASPDVHVMTGRLDVLRRGRTADAHEVQLAEQPGETWFARYRDGRGAEPAARALLTRHDHAMFATVTGSDGEPVAIGRGAVDDDWLAVGAVEVAPDHRRRGLARAVVNALEDWAAGEGATRAHLEVSEDNPAALALYDSLGYRTHHRYRYRNGAAPVGP